MAHMPMQELRNNPGACPTCGRPLDEKLTYTPREFAEALGCSLTLVYRYLHAGRIPHFKLATKLVIPRLAVYRWLEQEAMLGLTIEGGDDGHLPGEHGEPDPA